MMEQHIDELAELYALGTLSSEQRAQVDWHARQCEECAARLGQAEEAVAALVEEREPSPRLDSRVRTLFARKAPMRRTMAGLIAAAFIIGLLPAFALWPRVTRDQQIASDRQAATIAMVNAHFSHAPFVSPSHTPLKAKVLFSRNADWLYIVAQTQDAYTVLAQKGEKRVVLGSLRVSGGAGELFVAHASGASVVLLQNGSRLMGSVRLPYRR